MRRTIHIALKDMGINRPYPLEGGVDNEERSASRKPVSYTHLSHYAFHDLHIEDMFHAGRENLTETEQFWNCLLYTSERKINQEVK